MKYAMLLGLLLVAGGCGTGSLVTPSDRLSPRTLAVAAHNAIEIHSHAAVADLTSPAYRKPMRKVLDAIRDYSREADKTAALIAQKVGQAPADRLRKETASFYRQLLPSPLQGAVKGDTVDWSRVEIREEGSSVARVFVNGQKGPFHRTFVFMRVKDAWYIEPLDSPKEFAKNAKQLAANYRNAIKALRNVQADIHNGEITPANVNARLWPTSGGAK
ncbi:MAG: hypothetical protein FWE88_03630 [Phycisphaerae bacterium]|nr:hypothetical protein [Phycisphaerae bacterium]